MNVDDLKDYISSYAVNVLKERGIHKLFPPQEEAVNKGLFSRKNMVIAIPTASGKTLIAELAMVKDVIEGGKCLYTAPLRALASEKYEEFRKWEKIGLKIGISIGDFESTDEWLGKKDIIVTTSEKADSLLRNGADTPGNIPVFGERVVEHVAHHAVFLYGRIERHAVEKIKNGLE